MSILERIRWHGIVRCPYYGSSYIWSDGFTPKGARRYQCQKCYKYFNDLTGTIFEHHHFPIEEMFYIINRDGE